MDTGNSKIVTACFILAGILAGVATNILYLVLLAIVSGSVLRWLGSDAIHHVFPLVVGFTVFLWLQLSAKRRAYASDVISEVKKIVWPTAGQTISFTLFVCVLLVGSGVVLGIFDLISAQLIEWWLHF